MIRPLILPATAPLTLLLLGCAPRVVFHDADIATLPKLGDVMWAQAQATDPQFKKIGRPAYSGADYSAFAAAGRRAALVAERVKASFSRGPEYDQLADRLAGQAADLIESANAKQADRASRALAAMKQTCRTCHHRFR